MTRVQLAVYDLSNGMASSLSQQILGQRIDGIWHTGVVVYSNEYYFGGGIQVSPFGTFTASNNLHPVQILDMGETNKTEQELKNYLSTIRNRFTAATYDLINNNCNNFSDTVCKFLVNHGIPSYIVDLPNIVFSTPGGMMLRPMIEGMQNNIHRQAIGTMDPFGMSNNNSVGNGIPVENTASISIGDQFESQIMDAVHNLTTQAAQHPPKKAQLEEKSLISEDNSAVKSLGTKILNLTNDQNESVLTDNEKTILQEQIINPLLHSKNNLSFSNECYELMNKVITNYSKAQMASFFIVRLMFLHDHNRIFQNIQIVNTIVKMLKNGEKSFASMAAYAMALCCISNLFAHENGLKSLLYLSQDDLVVNNDSCNELVDICVSGMSHIKPEIRQMSSTLAYNYTLVNTKNSELSNIWNKFTDDELHPHAVQLLLCVLENLQQESDSIVRKRKLSIALRIIRSYGKLATALCSDLGFVESIQMLRNDKNLYAKFDTSEKVIVDELSYAIIQ